MLRIATLNHKACCMNEDTLLDHVVLQSSQILHQNIDEESDGSRQDADEPTNDPATYLQTSEALYTHTHKENS